VIRKALGTDAEQLNRMGQRFVADTPYGDLLTISPVRLAETIGHLLGNPDGVVLVSEKGRVLTGMIGLLAYNHPFSGERTAFEVVWWVQPEARGDGVRLLKAAEEWAREQGIQKVQMVAPNERVGALYQRLGYVPVETSYQRSL
jgi:GNAT superfamily N-acetyltransferase